MRAVIIMIGALFLGSCSGQECRQTSIEGEPVDLTIDRIEADLFGSNSSAEVEEVLKSNPSFSRLFLDADEYPNYSVLADKFYKLTKEPSIDTLYGQAKSEFEDMSSVETTLEASLGRMKSLFPEMKIPRLQTVVTGLYNDLYISDSLLIVGLDYYIGDDAAYPPANIPKYILSRYDKEHLPITIIKFLSGSYVSKGKKETLLSEMIDFGKSFYLLGQLMPCTPDSIIMGYTPMELKMAEDNHAVIWANFVENEVLYESNHLTKRKFLGERPNVYEISQQCPGRIGAWIGWQIVESYMSNNDVDIKSLIGEKDNDKIFRLSGYKPKG
ncbi:MAG: hypothetical protein JXR03_14640 [Cyclobacteriaceae bacterium]